METDDDCRGPHRPDRYETIAEAFLASEARVKQLEYEKEACAKIMHAQKYQIDTAQAEAAKARAAAAKAEARAAKAETRVLELLAALAPPPPAAPPAAAAPADAVTHPASTPSTASLDAQPMEVTPTAAAAAAAATTAGGGGDGGRSAPPTVTVKAEGGAPRQ